jgi:hypothetical protein
MHAHTRENKNEIIINGILGFIKEKEFTLIDWRDACYKYGFNDGRTIRKYLQIALVLGLIEKAGLMTFRKKAKI